MSTSLNILVVEDDSHVAEAIEAMLLKGFAGCKIVKAASCRAAMSVLMSQPFRLVISDWNMPTLTGVDLLHDVRRNNRTRHIPFLMLTARSDKESVITAIKSGANDYVCKPFQRESLLAKVGKLLGFSPNLPATRRPLPAAEEIPASEFANLLAPAPPQDESIVAVAERLKQGSLGSLMLPSVASKIQEVLKSSDPSVDLVCDVVKLDPALATKLIGIANSPHYLRTSKCTTLRDAVMRLGFREASHCIMALTTKELFSSHVPMLNDILAEEWRHGVATAFLAELIAKHLSLPAADDHFTLGLVHDIGKLLLLKILQDLSQKRPLPALAEIREFLESQHADFGRELLKRWNFTQPYIDIAYHHHNIDYLRQAPRSLQVVGFANWLADLAGQEDAATRLNSEEIREFSETFGLHTPTLEDWLKALESYLANV